MFHSIENSSNARDYHIPTDARSRNLPFRVVEAIFCWNLFFYLFILKNWNRPVTNKCSRLDSIKEREEIIK